MDKKFYDENAFYVEEKRWGTWQSYHPDGKSITTSLTEEECVRSARFYLKLKQDGTLDKPAEKTYSSFIEGKL